jgi:hypothetical protein
MRWFDSPPCSRLDLTFSSDDQLSLSGPGTGARVMGGATAAFGGVFASFGLRFLRLPVPLPFKLIPLAFTAIGGGIAAAGTAAALSSCSVEAKRGDGLTLRWKLPLREERSLRLRPEELEAFEVTEHAHHSDDNGFDRVTMEFRVVVITKAGRAVEVESFGTRTQAQLRMGALKKILLPG